MKHVGDLKCHIESTIDETLRCIDASGKHVAFIVDNNGVMKGLVTDGDVRRLLLSGHGMKEKIETYINRNYVYARIGTGPDKIASLFNNKVSILPILDHDGRVVDYSEYNEDFHIPVAQPILNGNEYRYLMDAFLSTWISSSGKYIDLFENSFAEFCNTNYGVATSNGTTALHLALVALGIGEGDEVIVPDLTFAATINSVIYTGAKPVIVDIDSDSWCIDPDCISKAITKRTKAIIPVHLYGQPCEMDKIMEIAEKNNLYVIEDCAEAHGAEFDGQKVGSIGTIGCFSFYGNKVVTTGEGGMCVTNDSDLNEKMRLLRDHGMTKERRYYHEIVGFNYRLTNLQAAIGTAQMERIDEILIRRGNLEDLYRKNLSGFPVIDFQRNDIPKRKKITWLVSALINENMRDELAMKMQEKGIDLRYFFMPLSEMDIYKQYARECRISHKIAKCGINFPTSFEVDENVIEAIGEILKTMK